MDLNDQLLGKIQVDTWRPTDTVRVQIGDVFVDLTPTEVDLLVAWLEATKEEASWRRQQEAGGEVVER